MPVQTLSLVGFLEPQEALNYRRNLSLLPDRTEPALMQVWADARAKLGEPVARAGCPSVERIPAEHSSYIESLAASQLVAPFAEMQPSFALVEIEPLLAYQFHIELPRSEMLVKETVAPTVSEMLPICLPQQAEAIPVRIIEQPNGVLIESRSLNLRSLGRLDPTGGMAGVAFGTTSPLVQVAKYGGRFYLRNGFHRTYALRRRGATHVPCMILEPNSADELGARGNGETFGLPLLESANPPTLAHYCQHRAIEVPMRVGRRMIQATWTEYILPEAD